MSTKPEDELARLRLRIASLEEDSQMFLNEHDENVRLHFENVDLREQNARLREALKWMIENDRSTYVIPVDLNGEFCSVVATRYGRVWVLDEFELFTEINTHPLP